VEEMQVNSTGYTTLPLTLKATFIPPRLIPESGPKNLLELSKYEASLMTISPDPTRCMRL